MKTIPIHDAKTNLSKIIKQATEGKVTYVGAYGKPQAMISPLPEKKPIKIGIYAHKYKPGDFDDSDIISSDPEIVKEFEESAERPFPNIKN